MFLRNYYNILAAGFFNTYSGIGAGQGNNSLQLRLISGINANPNAGNASPLAQFRGSVTTASQFLIGSGNTPPTYDDYKLESQIPTVNYQFATLSSAITYDADNKRWVMTITNTIINTSAADFTVSEIAVTVGSSSIICYRAVLDTPITVTPGNAVNITIPLEYQMPLDM